MISSGASGAPWPRKKGFIADAAHELRRPLNAVQLQLELARCATTPEERATAFDDLQRGVSRATHLIAQLLTLARQEPGATNRPLKPIDLVETARLAEQAPLAVDRHVDVGLSNAVESVVQGNPEALRVMLGNLVDNAIRYTPAGGRVDVAVNHADRHAALRFAILARESLRLIAGASLTASFVDTSLTFPEAAWDSPSWKASPTGTSLALN